MSTGPLLVTARLASALAGDPPQLDALLEWALSPFEASFRAKQNAGLPHYHIDRSLPAPPLAAINIPILRQNLGPWPVAKCSNPVMPVPEQETVEHICKKIAAEYATLLAPGERRIVATTNAWTKSYRLPLRIRIISCVRWACVGNRRNVAKALRDVPSLGKKVADGYGRIREWEIEDASEDYSWFAPHPNGTLLMRTLPAGKWLPKSLIGFRSDHGACCPPYWHPPRWCEIVTPC